MPKRYEYTQDRVVNEFCHNIIDPIQTENQRLTLQNELLHESNKDYNIVIGNLRARIDELKGFLVARQKENTVLLDEIRKITTKYARLREKKRSNEEHIFDIISDITKMNDRQLVNLRNVVQRNKELHDECEQLKNLLNDKVAEIPLDDLTEWIKTIPFFTYCNVKLKKVFKR